MSFFDNLNKNCSDGERVIVEIGGGGSGGGGTVYWSDIVGTPLEFPPTAHTHTISEVDGLNLILSNINDSLEDAVTEAELTPLLEDKADKVHAHPISQVNGLQVALDSKLDESEKGSANGLAELDGSGKVPSSQLPSYVDDVEEYDTDADFPIIGESGKIYITRDTNLAYRWSGTNYAEISPSLALGETIATAYRGDRGKVAYEHAVIIGNPHNTQIGDIENLQTTLEDKANTSDLSSVALSGDYNDLSNLPTIESSPIILDGSSLLDARTNANGNRNIIFGNDAGRNSYFNTWNVVFIGDSAGQDATDAEKSIFIGAAAGLRASGSIYSNFIGNYTGSDAKDSTFSNLIGYNAGSGLIGAELSNFIGYSAGASFSGNNVGINNIIIGSNISLPNATSDSINLGGVLFGTGTHSTTTGNPSIEPTPDGRIGIGVVNPSTTLEVNGVITASGGNSDDWNNKVDAVAGKGLSTNDYSNDDKGKLDSIGLEWFGTRSEYDALGTYNPTTKYFIEKEG